MTAACDRSSDKKRAQDDADQAVRRAVVALVQLGALEALSPADRARIGAAATAFTREIHAITRRRNPRGRRGTQRGRRQPAGTHNPEGAS